MATASTSKGLNFRCVNCPEHFNSKTTIIKHALQQHQSKWQADGSQRPISLDEANRLLEEEYVSRMRPGQRRRYFENRIQCYTAPIPSTSTAEQVIALTPDDLSDELQMNVQNRNDTQQQENNTAPVVRYNFGCQAR